MCCRSLEIDNVLNGLALRGSLSCVFDLWNLSPGWCLISRSVFGWMRARPSKENLQTLGLTRGVRELSFSRASLSFDNFHVLTSLFDGTRCSTC